MKKIPTLYVRDPLMMSRVKDEVHPACLWVFAGEGVATRKWDGTCCRKDGGHWLARREVKPGKPTPANYMEEDVDPVTGKSFGWVPIEESSHYKAFLSVAERSTIPGTYELCGPKVNGNPEGFDSHVLIPHGAAPVLDVPVYFRDLGDWLADCGMEGIVWHHPDGRRAKIKAKDFGHYRRPITEDEHPCH